MAINRQLLPRRRCHIAHSRLPRRGGIAGRHEPRALRVAGAVGPRSRGHHPNARNGKQRQGNLRQVRGARARPQQRDPQSVLRIRQLSDSLSLPPAPRSIACSRTCKAKPEAARLAAFVSATGSAGTIAAGDYLKSRHGSKIVAVEAIECPTMLCNGYGEHNIQGIGDKHIPLIHNVMNTDVVVGVSDLRQRFAQCVVRRQCRARYLPERRKIDPDVIRAFDDIGISGLGQHHRRDQGRQASRSRRRRRDHDRGDRQRRAVCQRTPELSCTALSATGSTRSTPARYSPPPRRASWTITCSNSRHVDRKRIFNLGYFTWVEQQGVPIEDFDRRKDRGFWRNLVGSGSGLGPIDRRVQRGDRGDALKS